MTFSCGEDTDCITLDVVGGMLVATLNISGDDGNAAECRDTGLYVPGGLITAESLPVDPVDGQEVPFLADDDLGIIWPFKYREGSASPYKWEAIGPTPLHKKVTSLEGLTGAPPSGYVDILGGTTGPQIVVPLEGDYMIRLDAMIDGAADGTATSASIKVGSTAASFDDAIANYSTRYISVSREIRKNAVPSGAAILMKYKKGSSANAGFGHRALTIWPVRVLGS